MRWSVRVFFFLVLFASAIAPSTFAQSPTPVSGVRAVIVYGETNVCERYRVLFRHDHDWFVRCESNVLANEAELMREARVLTRGAIPGREPFLIARVDEQWLLYDIARGGAVELPEDLDAQREILRRLSTTEPEVPAESHAETTTAPTEEQPAEANFWDQAWPFVIAGVLLAGAATFVIITATQQRSEPTPTLRVETVPLVVATRPIRF